MKRKAFTLIELLVVVAIIALLISILLPSLSRAREMSKRLVCGANTKGIGTSCKIYANDNNEIWPIPAFDYKTGTKYDDINWYSGGMADPSDLYPPTPVYGTPDTPGRYDLSIKPSTANPQGAKNLTTTRAFWMLIRTGDNAPKQYICPSSGDSPDPTEQIDLYYDFTSLDNISYGYQVPYAPTNVRPGESLDARMVCAADRNPFSTVNDGTILADIREQTMASDPGNIDIDSAPSEWKRFNSSNHGGRGAGEGQNCLFADGHSSFEKRPVVGVDEDNIYTQMSPAPTSSSTESVWRYAGRLPSAANYPGHDVFGTDNDSSTDCLIFP